ncbi:hypothetical protein V5O48_007333 [Marasmius crinis-equi]|uniref:Cytochrome P450 n=1 Tax=Marasmius crinis-equi TaxID=585013 RepID=A0ABR3FH00_9AGAR
MEKTTIFYRDGVLKLDSPFLIADIDIATVLCTALFVFGVERVFAFRRKLRSVNYLPGIRSAYPSISLIGALMSTRWWQAALNVTWIRRERLYRTHETISVVPWLFGVPYIYTSNLDVAKQILSTSQSVKGTETTVSVTLYGPNVLSTDGDEWRKHRRIMAPAFSNTLYQLVWDESLKTYRDMVSADGWLDRKTVDITELQKNTFKFALIVLGTCAFGFDFDWSAPPTIAEGEMSVQEAMRIVIDRFLFLIFAPGAESTFELAEHALTVISIRTTLQADRLLESFMQDQVRLRREELRGHTSGQYRRKDAFSMLVQANESDENAKNKLTDKDLIGNVFVMLFAGHETTANTLAATLALLAITSDAQDEVLKQIIDVVGWDRDPVSCGRRDPDIGVDSIRMRDICGL